MIVELGPFALILIVVAFFLTKLYMIYSKGLGKHFGEVFYISLIPISKQGIKNTFQDKVKKYYRASNVINYFFYGVFALSVLVYAMMKSIS
ncbi:hypothetical protein CAP35_09095 [Chitinophagaceae bacterium IBVUCB1]|nr:hypothetical protein CAP35_09095 [Chitinophagaceae bacterium IBVUCB1]